MNKERSLREKKSHISSSDKILPAWIQDTKYLKKILTFKGNQGISWQRDQQYCVLSLSTEVKLSNRRLQTREFNVELQA